jgi:cytochrome c553
MRIASFFFLLLACAAAPCFAASASNGNTVYHEYCVSCHGDPPQGGPDRAGNNPTLISNALNGGVPAMAFLRGFVSGTDIQDIAAYVASLSGTVTPPLPPVPAFDYTDLWWAGDAESGWGLNLTQHPSNKIFGIIYTYDIDRRPMWLVLPDGAWATPTLYSGTLYRVTGPPQNGVFDSARVRVQPVGTATLSFADRDHALFTYTVNGAQVNKLVSRTPF